MENEAEIVAQIEKSKLLDIPEIFEILLGKFDFDSEREKVESKKIIQAVMQIANQPELEKVFEHLMKIKDSIKPYRDSLQKIDSTKKYYAELNNGQLVLSENDLSKLESQKDRLKKEGKQELGMVSGGFIANFIHNFKAGNQLGQNISINLQEKFGENLQEIGKVNLVEDKSTEQITEVNNEAIEIEKQHLADFNEFKNTLDDIYKSNVQTINKSKCYKVDFETFKKFNSVGLNLTKASDSFIVGLVEGHTTSSVSVNLFDGNGKSVEKELSYKLSGILEKPTVSISTQSQKYQSMNIRQNIKRTLIKGKKATQTKKSFQKI